ncbi:acyl carrier protein [Paracoccus sp. SY]|uniref:acyl carrier protein n=1 Tax=Paracoccus sp. SY TaxID=1330255 RepID=UPI000CD20A37|nr:acyl carrier protein [Paracoccus sp. SY]
MSIEQRVKEILVMHLGVNADQVTSQASLIDDLGADSLDAVELSLAIEEEFDVILDDDVAERCQTVADLVAAVKGAEAA